MQLEVKINESDILYLKDEIEHIEKSIEVYLKEYYTYMFLDKISYTSRIETRICKVLKYIYGMYVDKKIDYDKYDQLRYRVDECLKGIEKKVIEDDEYVVFVPREMIKMDGFNFLMISIDDHIKRGILEDDIKKIIESFEKGSCSLKSDYPMMTLENLVNYSVTLNNGMENFLNRITCLRNSNYLNDEIYNDFKSDIERIKKDMWCWLAKQSLTSDSIINLNKD